MFQNIVLIITSLWMFIIAGLFTTKNFQSHLFFKATPLVLGVLNVAFALKGFGIL